MFNLTNSFANKFYNELSRLNENLPALGDWSKQASAFPLEMWEDTAKVYIEADLPGVTAEDLDVSIYGDRNLRIAATRQNKTEKTEGTTHFKEVSYGYTERLVSLPECADEETIDARLKNGVLTVTLNKRAGTVTRKVEVKS